MEQLEISVAGSSSTYPILIGSGLLTRVSELLPLADYSKIIVCVDRNLTENWLPSLLKGVGLDLDCIEISASEAEKSVEQAENIWRQLLKYKADRYSLLLNLGGGLTGDLCGFAASTFMRGIDFIQLPTTLLAQVDASVGGKVAVNFDNLKNIIGCFNQPRAVVIDTESLLTLPTRELASGFAEVIKHGLIADRDYFEFVAGLKTSEIDCDIWQKIIFRSCQLKAAVVSNDEREAGLRKILNFGHTVGHALESLSIKSARPLLHGEALAIGIVAESHISMQQGLISSNEFDLIVSALSAFDLPTRVEGSIEQICIEREMQFDKKNFAGKVKWSLLDGIGKACYDSRASEKELQAALSFIAS